MERKKMTEKEVKTHWLQNPNKNYLGHWDLPGGKDVILTIKTAQWEEVKNPIINVSEAKRVIRFVEDGIKPFICNETNAQSILRSTKHNYMEDCEGMKIKLFLSQVNVKGQKVDCLRVREVPQSDLVVKYISDEQRDELLELIALAKRDVKDICELMQIKSISKLPLIKYKSLTKRLKEIGTENADN
jgi:hypothetical protein